MSRFDDSSLYVVMMTAYSLLHDYVDAQKRLFQSSTLLSAKTNKTCFGGKNVLDYALLWISLCLRETTASDIGRKMTRAAETGRFSRQVTIEKSEAKMQLSLDMRRELREKHEHGARNELQRCVATAASAPAAAPSLASAGAGAAVAGAPSGGGHCECLLLAVSNTWQCPLCNNDGEYVRNIAVGSSLKRRRLR